MMQTDMLFFAVLSAVDMYGIRDRERFLRGIAGYMPDIVQEDRETQGAFIKGFAECWQRIERGAIVTTL